MNASAHHRVAIVGDGLACAALPIALAQRGIEGVIIERDPAWAPLSTGIFVYANGLRALRIACAALIGTGIRSQVRDHLFGVIEPVYSGLGACVARTPSRRTSIQKS